MAKQSSKSPLSSRLGKVAEKAFDSHKDDEVKFSAGGDLPPIEAGIAKLVKIGFGIYKDGPMKGKDYFMESAVVVEPKEYRGLRTSVGPEPLCDTPTRSRKDVEAHLAFVMNEYKKLGVNIEELSLDGLEPTAEMLQESGIYTRFRTWKGSKQEIIKKGNSYFVGDKKYKTEAAAKAANPYVGQEPRTQHDWRGVVDYIEEGDEGVEDESAEAEEEEVEEEVAEVEEESTEVEADAEAEEESDDTESDAEEEDDGLDELAKKADKKDVKSQKELTKLAKAAGLDEEAIEGVDKWAELPDLIREASNAEEGEEEAEEEAEEEEVAEEEEEWKPSKGDALHYKRVDPKTKKAKKVEVEVLTVSEKTQTVTLKDLDSGKTIVGADKKPLAIKWDKLVRDE